MTGPGERRSGCSGTAGQDDPEGAFHGTDREEACGVLDTGAYVGAFGAKRQQGADMRPQEVQGEKMMIMKRIALGVGALLMGAGAAIACDDHVGQCEIEDWTHTYTAVVQSLRIDGVATCDAGQVRLRLYDGEGETRKLVGVDTAYIEGHIFQALLLPVEKPATLSIKYSIQPE